MTIQQDLKKLQRELDRLAKQSDKLAAAFSNLEAKKPARAAKKKTAAKKPATKSAAPKKPGNVSDAQKVIDLIKQSKDGMQVKTLRAKTGFDTKKISNILYKATRSGQIKSIARGLYAAA